MTLTIELTPEQEARLEQRAAQCGLAPAEYALALIERDLQCPPTLAEIVAPIRRQVEESGITDNELDALFEEAREEVFQRRNHV